MGVLAVNLDNPDLHDLAGTALFAAAQSDYMQGAWFGFLNLAELNLRIHGTFDREPMDFDRHEILKPTLLSLAVILALGGRYCPSAQAIADSLVDRTALRADAEDVIGVIAADWSSKSDKDLAALIEDQLGHSAFSDAGSERTVAWRALGIAWSVTFANTYETVRAAERFIAIAQILLADLADFDLCLLPTVVSIRLTLTEGRTEISALPSNNGRLWEVDVRPHDGVGYDAVRETQIETLAMIMAILREISVLPEEQVDRRTEAAFEEGIVTKVTHGRVYDVLYANSVSEEQFERSSRERCTPLRSVSDLVPPEHPELAWCDGPGPGYTRAKSEEFLTNRYETSGAWTRWTRARLSASPTFNTLVQKVRAEGWLDWQILAAVFGLAHHYRTYLGGSAASDAEFENRSRRWMQDEDPDWPTVPPEEFTEEGLRRVRDGNMLATLKVWGLELRQVTPDLRAIE